MKPRCVILVGPSLSGKDTYLDVIKFTGYDIISRDDILMSLSDSDDYTESFHKVNQKVVDKLLNEMINRSIENSNDFVVNMTNLSKKTRKRHLSKLQGHDYEKIAIVFPKLELEEYFDRNQKRFLEQKKLIPESVIKDMITRWEEVGFDEGFDEIIKL